MKTMTTSIMRVTERNSNSGKKNVLCSLTLGLLAMVLVVMAIVIIVIMKGVQLALAMRVGERINKNNNLVACTFYCLIGSIPKQLRDKFLRLAAYANGVCSCSRWRCSTFLRAIIAASFRGRLGQAAGGGLQIPSATLKSSASISHFFSQ